MPRPGSCCLACLLALVLGAPPPAAGADNRGARLRNADTDGDGLLSRAEASRALPALAAHFDAIDVNRDGALSPHEIRAWRKVRRAGPGSGRARFDAHFRQADGDGDGSLSRSEAERALPRVARKFERIDSDRNGGISLAEMHAWLDARRGARARPPR